MPPEMQRTRTHKSEHPPFLYWARTWLSDWQPSYPEHVSWRRNNFEAKGSNSPIVIKPIPPLP